MGRKMGRTKALPPLCVANVIAIAADALNRIDGDVDVERANEQRRVRTVRSDHRAAHQAAATLRRLARTYLCGALLRQAESQLQGLLAQLEPPLADESDSWLTPRPRGKQRRQDHQAFAAMVRVLTADDWSESAACAAVATLADQVWTRDPRTRAAPVRRALWGKQVDKESREERIVRLTEAIRQVAQDRKRTNSSL